jgi:hypothetical protein
VDEQVLEQEPEGGEREQGQELDEQVLRPELEQDEPALGLLQEQDELVLEEVLPPNGRSFGATRHYE